MEFDTNDIKLKGIYAGVPKNISFFADEIDIYNQEPGNSHKLQKSMGFDQHRICRNETTVKEIAVDIIRAYIDEGNIKKDDIDALIVISQIPDHFIPNMSSQIHGELELNQNCFCLDINDGCAGFLRGVSLASLIVQNDDVQNILVVTGDILSRKVSNRDRNSFPLIGDAVTVSHFIKSDTESKLPRGKIFHDGRSANSLLIPAGGLKEIPNEDSKRVDTDEDGNSRSREDLVMKGRDVFSFTQSIVAPFLEEYYSEVKESGIKMIFSHQANEFIISRLRKKLKISKDKFPSSVINLYGNSSSATIPLQILHEGESRSDWGQSIMITGFGVGLSWSAACLNLDGQLNLKLIEGDY